MQSIRTRRDEARFLNQLIDHALFQPTTQQRKELIALANKRNAQRLAERVRRRATWVSRHEREQPQRILSNRDELIMTLYASIAPEGWANAWCDGSSRRRASERHAGIGAVLLDAAGKCVSKISRYAGNKSAFDAELTALAAVLEDALKHHIERLRVHSDCKALVQLWCKHRQDPRLAPVRLLAHRFSGLHIHAVPRLHNQTANALAKRASLEGRPT